ncbi:MAG: pyridoxamine 5'-phosphate oxidase family protein [Clostridia bacterium]|nr:pyridoxamine 5'-phosphate oxidase family protein [Clostridia bacterium]
MDTIKKAYKFLKGCEYFAVTSINDKFPAVRPFGAIMEHKNYLYISTSPTKEVYTQLKSNGHIQIFALKSGTREWIRITGFAKECTDLEIKKLVLGEYPILLKHFDSEKSKNFILFQIEPLKFELKKGEKLLMERKIFNKLVRDEIPEMLDKNGGETETEILNTEKYKECLYAKLKEECEEVITADSKENLAEELADLLEVMKAIAKINDIDFAEIEKIRAEKKEKRGGFDRKIFLKSSNIVKI